MIEGSLDIINTDLKNLSFLSGLMYVQGDECKYKISIKSQ